MPARRILLEHVASHAQRRRNSSGDDTEDYLYLCLHVRWLPVLPQSPYQGVCPYWPELFLGRYGYSAGYRLLY